AAVHAQGVVDVESVEVADRAGLAAGASRRGELLVALDVDAPVGAGPGAQHADGAVVLAQGDDAARTRRRRLLLLGVLHGVGALAQRPAERPQGDAQALCQARNLRVDGHQTATFKMAVTTMLAIATGMRTFHAKRCSWSTRNRGKLKRTHMMMKLSRIILVKMISGPATFIQSATSSRPVQSNQLNGTPQPPRKSTEAMSENTPTVANSAMKKMRK